LSEAVGNKLGVVFAHDKIKDNIFSAQNQGCFEIVAIFLLPRYEGIISNDSLIEPSKAQDIAKFEHNLDIGSLVGHVFDGDIVSSELV